MATRNLELEWLHKRKTGIGSSDAPVLVLGEVYGKKPLNVYLSKKAEPEQRQPNPDLRRGHTYEPLAIALFEQRYGVKVHAPCTDEERYETYHLRDPERGWLYADLDGFCEDGWVMEVKSPRQRRCDQFRTTGATDYYQVQCHHLAHVANVAPLPFLPDPGAWVGKIKGTRLIVYEPENVDLMVFAFPYDAEATGSLVTICQRFWEDHVLADVPPYTPAPPRPAKKKAEKGKGGKYVPVQGEAWEQVAGAWFMAKQLAASAESRLKKAKAAVQEMVVASGSTHVITEAGLKFQYDKQAGRRTLNTTALRAAYPQIDLEQFTDQGADFMVLRAYGASGEAEADSLSEGIESIQDELEAFAGRDLPVELAVDLFEELRNEAELYERLLTSEVRGIRNALDAAADACQKKVLGK